MPCGTEASRRVLAPGVDTVLCLLPAGCGAQEGPERCVPPAEGWCQRDPTGRGRGTGLPSQEAALSGREGAGFFGCREAPCVDSHRPGGEGQGAEQRCPDGSGVAPSQAPARPGGAAERETTPRSRTGDQASCALGPAWEPPPPRAAPTALIGRLSPGPKMPHSARGRHPCPGFGRAQPWRGACPGGPCAA